MFIPTARSFHRRPGAGEDERDEDEERLSGGDGMRFLEERDWRRPSNRPASNVWGVTDERRPPRRICSCSFSSSSISTSFISSPTPSSGDISRPSLSIFKPKMKNSRAAMNLVNVLGISVGIYCPNRAERTVMTISAEKAAEKTSKRGCLMAIRAATRNVLSPISETTIMVNEKTSE